MRAPPSRPLHPPRSGPREDATRIGSAGVVRRQAVDISPLRRVNQVGGQAAGSSGGAQRLLLAALVGGWGGGGAGG